MILVSPVCGAVRSTSGGEYFSSPQEGLSLRLFCRFFFMLSGRCPVPVYRQFRRRC